MMQGVSSAMMYCARPRTVIGIPFTTDGFYLMNCLCNQQSLQKVFRGCLKDYLAEPSAWPAWRMGLLEAGKTVTDNTLTVHPASRPASDFVTHLK